MTLFPANGEIKLDKSTHKYILEGHKEIVELLLNVTNIDVNKALDGGTTPLFVASEKGHKEIVELLLM